MRVSKTSLRTRLVRASGLVLVATLGSIGVARADSEAGPIAPGAGLERGRALPAALPRDSEPARPLSLASADFDVDGFPDLVGGYGTPDGGILEFRMGNPEAFAPRDPEVLEGISRGRYPSPFASGVRILRLAAPPDFLVSGDFDRDRNLDLVVAARGGTDLYLVAGDGKGDFAPPRRIRLPGRVTALTSGEIDVPDDHADLVVGIAGEGSAALLVYQGTERGILDGPVVYPLDAPATSLTLGDFDDTPYRGLAIVAGGEVTILHGRNQRAPRDTRDAISSRTERVPFPFGVRSLVTGFFEWNREGRAQMVLAADDGAVHIARRGNPDSRPYTQDEVRALRRRSAEPLRGSEPLEAARAWALGSTETWHSEVVAAAPSVGLEDDAALPVLLSAPVSGRGTDELMLLASPRRPMEISRFDTPAPPGVLVVDAGDEPAAALAMRLGVDVRPGLVLLTASGPAPTLMMPAAPVTIIVNDVTDTIHAAGCAATGTGTCSLRDAVIFSNQNVGADTITFAASTNGIALTLTIANTGGGNNNEDLAQRGDLDINDSVTIVGNGTGNTIIQAGTTNANGIDKVFAINPICASAVSASLSGLTIRFGRNVQPFGAADFSYTGGGLDWCSTGTGGLTMTNTIVSDNTNVTGYGGGINLDSVAPATGTVAITGTTITNNKTLASNSGANGGGMNLFGDRHNVTLTSCQITNNTATAAEGGGVFVRHTNGGAIAIRASTISGNVAGSRGGGVSILGTAVATNTQAVTVDQASVITGNTSQGAAGAPSLTAEGGGVYAHSASSLTTTTLDKVTITANTASLASADQRGGGGIATGGGAVTVRNSRIVNNTAGGLGGSGLHKDLNGGTTTAAGNWWGCSTGPIAAPCDTAVMSGGGSGTPILSFAPFIVLTHTASPSAIGSGQTSALTASFLKDSAGGSIPLSSLEVLIGRPIVFNNPVRGTLSAAQATIQANGTATATFTATSCGAGSADATVDNQPSTAPITIVCPPSETAPGTTPATALRWTDRTTLTWPTNAQATTGYRLYRSTQAQFPGYLTAAVDSCLRFTGANETTTTASGLTDDPVAVAGRLYGYVVTGVNIGGEGTAGNGTGGPRVLNSSGSCP